ncbi:MAG TPA: hypothetical protein VNI01_12385 [Elusimicrobiota bacterium]|jgi:hypothetical protein|nr:hypothetical protein [Elusimicrobiota bacterium]
MQRAFLAAFLLLAAACRKEEEIQVYRLAKPAAEAPAGLPAGHPAVGAQAPVPAVSPAGELALHWKTPAGWAELPGSGMRAASFQVPGGAELSVVTFPGDAGGVLANVNRWRGQFGLAPLPEAELPARSSRVASPAGEAVAVDFPGEGASAGKRLLAAMLPFRGASWFFKLTGPEAAVAAAKPAFTAFLGSLHPRD